VELLEEAGDNLDNTVNKSHGNCNIPLTALQ
jgi:hypothetical protein